MSVVEDALVQAEERRAERRQEAAREEAEVIKAFGWFLTPEGQLVLKHLEVCWYGRRTPATQLGSGAYDQGLTTLNLGKQAAYFDVLRWIELAKQEPRAPQTSARRAAPER